MICYFHASELTPPKWLLDAPSLACRPVVGGHTWGIGNGWELSEPPSTAVELAGGWLAWVPHSNEKFDVASLKRTKTLFDCTIAAGSEEKFWWAPIVVNKNGERNFSAKCDENWLPVLSQEQSEILSIVNEFRTIASAKYAEADGNESIEVNFVEPKTCAWAARLLSSVNHVTPEVLGKLQLMDEVLVTSVLLVASSWDFNA